MNDYWGAGPQQGVFHIYRGGRSLCRRSRYEPKGKDLQPDLMVIPVPNDCLACVARFNTDLAKKQVEAKDGAR